MCRDHVTWGVPMQLLRVTALAVAICVLAPPPPVSAQILPNAAWSCEFANSATDCGFYLQAVASNRAAVVGPGRDGSTAIELTPYRGYINLAGSDSNDRADLPLPPSWKYGNQGQDEWWAHSLMFPPSYVAPPGGAVWNWGALFDFHNSSSGGGQPNFMVYATPTGLELHMAGGANTVNRPTDPGYYSIAIGPIAKNVWYDFVYHVKWSSGSDGLFQAWLNGRQVMNYSGPNLYVSQSCYLKIANYHSPLGVPVSVIHSRVVLGHTQADVQIGSPPPPTVLVPNVVGQMQAAATSAIIGAGLTLGTVTMQSSTTVAPGNVISDRPAAGTSVASGLAVNLVVSSGAPPPAPVPVPNVVGQTQAAATSAITGAGLTVGTVTMQSSTTVPSGNVIGQNPAAGAQSASGPAADLVVSTGGGTSSGGGGGGASGGGGAFDSFTLAALLSSLIGGLWRARRIRDSVLRRETRGLRTSGNHQPAGGVGATSADVCLLRRVRVALCNRSSIGFSTSLYLTAANSSAKNLGAAGEAIDPNPGDQCAVNLRHITRARCNEKTCVK